MSRFEDPRYRLLRSLELRTTLTDAFVASSNFHIWSAVLFTLTTGKNGYDNARSAADFVKSYTDVAMSETAIRESFQMSPFGFNAAIIVVRDPRITMEHVQGAVDCDECCINDNPPGCRSTYGSSVDECLFNCDNKRFS